MKPAKTAWEVLPLRSTRPCPRCSFRLSQRRALSSTTGRRATLGQMQMPKKIASSLPKDAGQSQRMRMKQMQGSQIPTDVGLLPNTFVSPPLRELYQMYQNDKRKLLKVIWMRIKRGFAGPATLVYFLKWNGRKDRLTGKTMKSPPLELTRRLETARQLHFKLNRAIADQDLPTLKSIACAGLMANIKSRLDAQKSTKKVRDTWSLVKYNGLRPPRWIPWPISSFIPNRAIKVMHDIIAPLPIGGKDASIRQVVVRMKSRQTFNRQNGKGLQSKELTEYVVIQKMTADGLDKDWMIWGTVLPSTAEQIDSIFEMEELTAGNGIWDKVRNLMPMGGGGGGVGGGASMM